MVRLIFCLWLAVSGFTLSQRQATSKGSIGIFVRFPLASLAGRSARTYDGITSAYRHASLYEGPPTRTETVMAVAGSGASRFKWLSRLAHRCIVTIKLRFKIGISTANGIIQGRGAGSLKKNVSF